MIKIEKYKQTDKNIWDFFIEKAKNATFLFKRNFMDYHNKIFNDYSLLIYEKNNLIAVFPANIDNNIIYSHQGLTYGGLVINSEMKLNKYVIIFREILLFFFNENIKTIYYKSMPVFYTLLPAQEDEYIMFLINAKTIRIDTTITINNKNRVTFQKRRQRSIKKSIKNNFIIREDNDFSTFWNEILTPNLKKRFGKKPVHSLIEITQLASNLPKNIKQINIFDKDKIIAGCTIFETEKVAHAQYISASDFGRKSGAIDELFNYLISNLFNKKDFFDFGICNEENGRKINHGLLDWKEGFGARTYTHKHYKIATKNYYLLNEIIQND